jgi:hypothetical protein
MRVFIAILLLSSSSLACAAETLKMYDAPLREEPSPYAHMNLSPAQLVAAQELETAQYRFLAWMNFGYAQRLRQLDADILMAQEELASLGRRQAEFSRFNVWSRGGNPLFLQSEDAHLASVAVEQRLRLLQAERGQVIQFQPVEYRERQIEVERARLNLRMAQ